MRNSRGSVRAILVCTASCVVTVSMLDAFQGQSTTSTPVTDKNSNATTVIAPTLPSAETQDATKNVFTLPASEGPAPQAAHSKGLIEEPARQEQQGLQTELGVTERGFEAKSQMHKVQTLSGEGGYSLVEFRATITSTKEELLTNLAGDNLAPMRAYVASRFPDEHPKTIQDQTGEIVPLPEVEQALGTIRDIIEKVKADALTIVDMQITTKPVGARAVLSVDGGSTPRETISNNSIHNLYRGRYNYIVTKVGFKDAVGLLDLVDEPGTILECSMARLAEPESSQCVQK